MTRSNRVAETNDSSTASKLSMVRAKYIVDDSGIYKTALEWFVKPERRTALINRGYFIRVEAIKLLFNAFISARKPELRDGEQIQIVNLGAGFDALFLGLLKQNMTTGEFVLDEKFQNCEFVEVDFDSVAHRKMDILQSNIQQHCNKPLGQVFPNYTLIGCDLTNAGSLQKIFREKCHLLPDRPTLFIAECVLNYLTAKNADQLLRTLSSEYQNSTFIIYEQIEPFDKFGQTMLKHFESINSPLLSISTYPDIVSHIRRYLNLGFKFHGISCWSIGHLYYNLLTSERRHCIASLEMFDEYEMWHAKCAHYVITMASLCELHHKRVLQFLPAKCLEPTMGVPELSLFRTSSLNCKLYPLSSSGAHYLRFAHKMVLVDVLVNGNRTRNLLSIGGWSVGDQNRQGRARKPCLTNLDDLSSNNCDIKINRTFGELDTECQLNDGARILERCYHTLSGVLDERTFLIFGGRRSPAEALYSPCLIKLKEDGEINIESIFTQGGPCNRWRHSATIIGSLAEASVAICGGLASNSTNPLSDFWLICLSDRTWQRLPDMPSAVHSHSACYFENSRLLIIIGGLSIDDQVNESVLIYSFEKRIWTTIKAPSVVWRYGMVSFVFSNSSVVVIGGASPLCGELHDVAMLRFIIDEHQLPSISYFRAFGLPRSDSVMLLNHDAVLDRDLNRILVLGGGGNCFSFGTCFNDCLLEISLCEFAQE